MIRGSITSRSISADINEDEINKIKAYIQGSVYCWCNNCKTDDGDHRWFAARDLFGGDNFFWQGTPLFQLYEWHEDNGAENPTNMAGRDVGYLLMDVLENDKRHFRTRKGYTREYQWTG